MEAGRTVVVAGHRVSLDSLDPRVARAIDPDQRKARVLELAHAQRVNSGGLLHPDAALAEAEANIDFIATVAGKLVELGLADGRVTGDVVVVDEEK